MRKILICVLAIMVLFACYVYPRQTTLTIGIFAGSNWDVPNGNSYQVIDTAIEAFEQSHPNIKVVYQSGILKEDYSEWLAESFLEGNEPDVFMVLDKDFNLLSDIGALKPLDNNIQNDADISSDTFYSSAIEAGKYKGVQYALPFESNPTLMFVNRTLLNAEGISMPDSHWTMQDFYEICDQVTKDTNGDGSLDQFGCYDYAWKDAMYGYGVRLFNDEGPDCYLNQYEVKEALRFVQKLDQLSRNYIITSDDFDMGRVAFSPMTYAQYRTYKSYPYRVNKYTTFEWDCVPMPSVDGQQNNSEVASLLFAISSNSSHSQEAWLFLKQLTMDPEIQSQLLVDSQGIPSLKVAAQSNELILDATLENGISIKQLEQVMERGFHASQFKSYDNVMDLLDSRIHDILNNSTDLDISLMNLQREIKQYLDR